MASNGHLGTGHDLTRALERLSFWPEGKSSQQRYALYNPNKLVTEVGIGIASKTPIGWSGPLHQGMHGTEAPIEIDLLYNLRGALIEGYDQSGGESWLVPGAGKGDGFTGFDSDERWFGSFCRPVSYGQGFKKLAINWPGNMSAIVVVRNVKAERNRWDMMLRVRAAVITLSVSVYRRHFVSSSDFFKKGHMEGIGGDKSKQVASVDTGVWGDHTPDA